MKREERKERERRREEGEGNEGGRETGKEAERVHKCVEFRKWF